MTGEVKQAGRGRKPPTEAQEWPQPCPAAAGAAPTLRYGPAGDSAPRLRLQGVWYGRKLPFGASAAPAI